MSNAFTATDITTEQLNYLLSLLDKQKLATDRFTQALADTADSLGIQVEVLRKYITAINNGDKAVSTLKRNTVSMIALLESTILAAVAKE